MTLALALVVDLAGFLVTATFGVTPSNQPADRGPAVAAGVLAVTATLLKACTNLLPHGPVALLVSWQPYALLVSGAAGLLLNQLSFQAGPLAASLPAITVVDPLVAVLLGVTVYDEDLRHIPLAIAGEVVFLGLFALAAAALTRQEQKRAPAA